MFLGRNNTVDRFKQQVVVLTLAEKLKEAGSWCGETHIQKSQYFLQELLKVPTGFDFVLYKHGPFSFDLKDELAAMRANLIFDLSLNPYPYGPSYVTGPAAEKLKELYSKTRVRYEREIAFVTEKLAGLGVAQLERLATALYVTLEKGRSEAVQARAREITRLKPHIGLGEAESAIKTVDDLADEARKFLQ
jgi:hypothetical protein